MLVSVIVVSYIDKCRYKTQNWTWLETYVFVSFHTTVRFSYL